MSVYQELVNLDSVFSKLPTIPVIVNDLSIASEEEKEKLKQQIYTRYDSDVMSTIPSCSCGETTGQYNIRSTCPICRTLVVSPVEQDLEALLWMRAPIGFPTDIPTLMNPTVWGMLAGIFKRSGFDLWQWICDTSYTSKNRVPEETSVLLGMGMKRGYINMVRNFDELLKMLFSLKSFRKHPKKEPFLRMLAEYPNSIFSRHLPIPNKSLLVLEDTNVGRYSDPVIVTLMNAVQMLISIDVGENDPTKTTARTLSLRDKENRVARTISGEEKFFTQYYKNNMGTKQGVLRKHVVATRGNWTFRSVISSMTKPHTYGELQIPWGVGIGVLKFHLLNKLDKRGFGANEALGFLNAHAQRYHPLLDQLFQELIAESPEAGIPCTWCRNPSLGKGSIQKQLITRVKTDTSDPTTSNSILDVNSLNADYDGDAMGGMLLLDHKLSKELDAHLPHKNSFDVSRPYTLSSALSIPKPVVANTSAWIHEREISLDQSAMAEFAV